MAFFSQSRTKKRLTTATTRYKPEFLLASEVTSNYMTQAKAYEAMGQRKVSRHRQPLVKEIIGFTGGLPHFGSDVFDDAYILLSQKGCEPSSESLNRSFSKGRILFVARLASLSAAMNTTSIREDS